MARKQNDNLIPQAHVLTVEEASKGGKASVEARRNKKAFREILESMLDEPGGTLNGEKATRKEVVAFHLLERVINGKGVKDSDFLKAFEIVRDTLGEKPTDKLEVSKSTSETVKEMKEYFEQLTESDSEND